VGTVYKRRNKLWISYKDAAGERQWDPTPYRPGEEAKARKALADLERRIEAERRIGAEPEMPAGPLTVKTYGERWLKARPAQGIETAKDDVTRMHLHVWPTLGDVPLAKLRPRHVRDLMRDLRSKDSKRGKALSPRTIRNVYGTLHRMLHDAVVDELLDTNPCVLKRGDLPAKADSDPAWRPGAVFTRGEGEQVISDTQNPEDRRVVNALLFLAGLRFGEAAALRWRDYDAEAEPLGRLGIGSSYNTKKRKVSTTKTERPRQVPVHPTLAKVLAAWKLSGWQKQFGRQPGPDDLIVPSRRGDHRNVNHGLRKFHQDLERLGLRKRRQHDLRRTFVTLSLADGARKDILRWVTHGPEGDIIDLYTTLPWATLCEEVAKLRVTLRSEAEVIPLRRAGGDGGASCDTPCDTQATDAKKPPRFGTLEASSQAGWTGLEPAPNARQRYARATVATIPRAEAGRGVTTPKGPPRSRVTVSHGEVCPTCGRRVP
jgi:integrase